MQRAPITVWLAACLLVACGDGGSASPRGSGGSGGAGAASGGSSGGASGEAGGGSFVPFAHAPLPQLGFFGGPVFSNPLVVPILYPNDPLTNDIVAFAKALPNSSYRLIASEYGVTNLSIAPAVYSPSSPAASIDDKEIKSALVSALDAAGPTPPNAIYVLFMPPGVSITMSGKKSCDAFAGYHAWVTSSSGNKVAYAVIARCAEFVGRPPIDFVTLAASHEIFEAATDPFSPEAPSWFMVDGDHLAWSAFGEGWSEVGDLCFHTNQLFYTPPDMPFAVQRIWSNLAAKNGDPCIPALGDVPFFDAVPVEESISIFAANQWLATKGASIPVGA